MTGEEDETDRLTHVYTILVSVAVFCLFASTMMLVLTIYVKSRTRKKLHNPEDPLSSTFRNSSSHPPQPSSPKKRKTKKIYIVNEDTLRMAARAVLLGTNNSHNHHHGKKKKKQQQHGNK
jgi:hypothetical protein